MGLIGRLVGAPGAVSALGTAARDVAEVFTPNATRGMELSAQAQVAAMTQYGEEFERSGQGWFDGFMNGVNRVPRPALALGTIGLFVYAMVDPRGFGYRMTGLSLVPEPLWWLLGAIVGFYFGAREAFHVRNQRQATVIATASDIPVRDVPSGAGGDNPALDDWRAGQD